MLTPIAVGNVTGALGAMRLVHRVGGRAAIQVNLAAVAWGWLASAALALLARGPMGSFWPGRC